MVKRVLEELSAAWEVVELDEDRVELAKNVEIVRESFEYHVKGVPSGLEVSNVLCERCTVPERVDIRRVEAVDLSIAIECLLVVPQFPKNLSEMLERR